ncbi:MAG TPA: chromate efflux transporter [Sphingomicrobium sp.]|nr:chromate efflux transporter [Sphingomicrobium sp.]
MSSAASPTVSLGEASRTWARIALLSFGGPAAQIGLMHRILVDEKKWIDEQRFLHGLNFTTLLPGPEAQQLATYIGWMMHGVRGGLVAGLLFIAPGIAAIMALSWAYVLYGDVGAVEGLLFGLKAAVLAIVVQALWRLASRALRFSWQRWVALAAFLVIAFTFVPFPVVVAASGVAGWWLSRGAARPAAHDQTPEPAGPSLFRRLLPWLLVWVGPLILLVALLGPQHVMTQVAGFFSIAALVTFGGAYAVLAFVAEQAVERFGWLQPGEMIDGLGMAETTPGPLIMVLQFVGFLAAYRDPGMLNPLLAGTIGGLIATFVTFAPCFLWIFAAAPYVERLRGNARLSGALAGILAAAVGVIASLALWFGIHALFAQSTEVAAGPLHFDLPVLESLDPWAVLLALLAAFALFRLKLGIATTVLIAAAAGIGFRLLGGG